MQRGVDFWNASTFSRRRLDRPSQRVEDAVRRLQAEVGEMPAFYRHALNKTMQEVLDEHLARPAQEQLSLLEELSLSRQMCVDAVKLYTVALETGKRELIDAAALLMRDHLGTVKEFCEAAARVANSTRDKVSAVNVGLLTHQFTRLMHAVCGDEHVELAQEFERRVATEIRLAIEDASCRGTTLTPDMVDEQVLEMDAMVPAGTAEERDR